MSHCGSCGAAIGVEGGQMVEIKVGRDKVRGTLGRGTSDVFRNTLVCMACAARINKANRDKKVMSMIVAVVIVLVLAIVVIKEKMSTPDRSAASSAKQHSLKGK